MHVYQKRIKLILISILFPLIYFTIPNSVFACCSNSECGGSQCINIPYRCGETGYGEGYCSSGAGDRCNDPPPYNLVCDPAQYCGTDGLCHGGGGTTGGGAYQYPTCGGGVLMCGSPALYLGNSVGSLTLDSQYYCEFKATCGNNYFPSAFIGDEARCGIANKGSCQANCACCPAGSVYNKTTTIGSTYTKAVSCWAANNPAATCNDWDDQYISMRDDTTSMCYCDCGNPDGCGRKCTGDGASAIWNTIVTCRTVTTTWACQAQALV